MATVEENWHISGDSDIATYSLTYSCQLFSMSNYSLSMTHQRCELQQ